MNFGTAGVIHRAFVRDQDRERRRSEEVVKGPEYDFSAKYLAVGELNGLIGTHCEVIRKETVEVLLGVMRDPIVHGQRQAYFLCREAANGLSSILLRSPVPEISEHAFSVLKGLLGERVESAQRAAAEALGALPFRIEGPDLEVTEEPAGALPSLTWEEVVDHAAVGDAQRPELVGRSLVAPLNGGSMLVVVKLARKEDTARLLLEEAGWMDHLKGTGYPIPFRFDIPEVMNPGGSPLFSLVLPSSDLPNFPALHPDRYAIAYVCNRDYFSYPNAPGGNGMVGEKEFEEVITRDAWLLGRLASLGIIHSAPIPLFHNRVQRDRRNDHGLYEWHRAGRLDRWLESCSYPNFGSTGIRDFEHFESFHGRSRQLYFRVGMHLLSLFLVAGSYFRNKDPGKVGLDRDGRPVDARDLFDADFLETLIRGIFRGYYEGFVERPLKGAFPLSFGRLAERMIEEMGIDRHMEEILRIHDQDRMTWAEFEVFLTERGFSREGIKGMRKGAEDIVIHTGPHLGGFNERISLPELIEAVAAMSALCISGRYWWDEKDRGRGNGARNTAERPERR